MRTFKIERIRDVALTPELVPSTGARGRPDVRAGLGHHRGPGARRRRAAILRQGREPGPRGALASGGTVAEGDRWRAPWRAPSAGPIEIRLWILSFVDDEAVLEPAALRASRARALSSSRRPTPRQRRATPPTGCRRVRTDAAPPVQRRQPDQRPDSRLCRADEAADWDGVAPPRTCPAEDAAEEDLLDTAWLQRLSNTFSLRQPFLRSVQAALQLGQDDPEQEVAPGRLGEGAAVVVERLQLLARRVVAVTRIPSGQKPKCSAIAAVIPATTGGPGTSGRAARRPRRTSRRSQREAPARPRASPVRASPACRVARRRRSASRTRACRAAAGGPDPGGRGAGQRAVRVLRSSIGAA